MIASLSCRHLKIHSSKRISLRYSVSKLFIFAVSSLSTIRASIATELLHSNKGMKSILYFVRHGETEANRDGILQGHSDFPLTDKGRSEAERVGVALSTLKFSKVFASDLKRVVTTSEILLAQSSTYKPDLEAIQFNPLLREMAFGVRESLSKTIPIAEAIKIVAEKNGIAVEDVVDTAETLDQILQRQKDFLSKVLYPQLVEYKNNKGDDDDSIPMVLCVSHGGFIRRLLTYLCNIEGLTGISNCSISIVSVEWPPGAAPEGFVCSAERKDIDITSHITEGAKENDEV